MLPKNNILTIAELLDQDTQRACRFSLRDAGWLFDYSRTPLTDHARAALLAELDSAQLTRAVNALFSGAKVNLSEDRAARHMLLRAEEPGPELLAQRRRFFAVAQSLHESKQIDDLLHIGIGGSDLGPRLVADALDGDGSGPRVHWLSTLDGRRFERLTRRLDPRRTGLIVASKSFTTEETLVLAEAARDWLGTGFSERAWACTATPERALAFGLSADHVLDFPSWTGGRFSLWSSVGVSAAAQLGAHSFERLLAGARSADQALQTAPDAGRLAVMVALLMHYLRRHLNLPSLGFISYEPRLGLLGDYLQQLIMESLGKHVSAQGEVLNAPSSPLIFGGRGTDLQHSIFQALHQGPDTHPLILLGALDDDHAYPDWHRRQLAHLLAQAQAFARGRHDVPSHQQLPGNRPVCLLLCERLTPEALGYLLASFEHAVYVLAVLWGINPFDQWGVEEGKRLAQDIYPKLKSQPPSLARLNDCDELD
ncbi:MAG: hypothetical protein ACXIUM_10125 [Wenzhouxiangella sp.]